MKTRRTTLLVALLLLVFAAIPVSLIQRQRSERAQCIMNLRNLHISLRSWAGMKSFSPGQPLPGGTQSFLLQSDLVSEMPVCPSGGTYTFWSPTTYNAYEDVRCSCAKTKGHYYREGKVPEEPKSPVE